MNALEVGQSRIGRLFSDDPDAPEVTVMLSRTPAGVRVTIPWAEGTEHYAKWFGKLPLLMSGSTSTVLPESAPYSLQFYDNHGLVHLVDCRYASVSSGFGGGEGSLAVGWAVFGDNDGAAFDLVTGLQTEISGLDKWLGIAQVAADNEWTDEGSLSSITLRVKALEALELSKQHLDLHAIPASSVSTLEDGWRVDRKARLRTISPTVLSWNDHLKVHQAMRDLLSIAFWQELPLTVKLADSSSLSESGEHTWLTVVDATRRLSEEERPQQQNLLFRYSNIETGGLEKWLRMRESYARALDLVLSSLTLGSRDYEAKVLLLSSGLDALGRQLLINDGILDPNAWGQDYHKGLLRIGKDISRLDPSYDVSAWVDLSSATYRGVKHANQPLPSKDELKRTWNTGVLAFRLWLAQELGCSYQALNKRGRLFTDGLP